MLKLPMVFFAARFNVDLAVRLAGTLALPGLNDAGSCEPIKNKDKDTLPEKPLTLMTFTVEVRDALCSRDIVEGLTVRRNDGPALPPLTYELSIVPPAAVLTAAVRTIRSPFR